MALHDAIALEIHAGALPLHFRAVDLKTSGRRVYLSPTDANERYRVGLDFFAANTINTQLANLCEHTGYWARNGQVARYRRVADGLYELLGLDETQELTAEVEPAAETPLRCDNLSPWEARFAFYLEHEPFQIYDRRRRKVYPAQAAQGLDARLSSYFWPSPGVNFVATEQVLQGFIAQAQGLSLDLAGNADAVLALFASICQWGGVRLPTQDADSVVANLQRAANHNAQNPAAMNSAWTKLYAMFYPDDFVIYDSRVATALVAIAEAVFDDVELDSFKTQYPNLGLIAGRGGSRPRATRTVWRNAYMSWPAQLEANRLVASIVQALNARSDVAYNARQLEAVLFMEGY
ncbi:hypothetical protein FBY10_104272 [Pseudomonas sp. SJZ103]|jgi:hypothetical protein|uniref:hypothetical protein n=1 Tax=unclassified Pseudomonas TaxID=196821 RepID=UPI0011A7960C|nr:MULTISPECIES: hypothetical protein [unclassified Pseudomonas]MBB6286308.1 hypothetical protein [Pseudomonas sp. SJZ073]MBB6311767.1 hypothetical protein [Pseudomonas sp. JAI120]MCS4313261.1 hypothetical protein [Pseudomonas sp. BIGb0381]TWC70870.1 hypothetical protein FBY10_104272 [Pseudomonas sp. SJZ103]TWC88409.1 hypothetical protein FBY08_103272 [Pseudomonas sp. SJZ094]